MKKLDLDECAIINRYEECELARVVADEFGCSDETIYRVLKRNGIQRTHRHPKKEKKYENKSNCRSKYCPVLVVMLRTVGGMRSVEVCNLLGVPSQAVGNILSRHGFARSRASRELLIKGIERDYLEGATTYELGKKYGVNHTTISKWMRQRGHNRGKGRCAERALTCQECGATFASNAMNAKFCSKACYWNSRGFSDHKSRAAKYGVVYESGITTEGLIKRDKNICQICGGECDSSDDRWGNFGPLYPTIDHIVAMSNGGGHTWDNVQLAHACCNAYKNNLTEDEFTSEVIARAKEQAITYQRPRVDRTCMG